MRPLTLFTGQWADLPLETLAPKAKAWGYDGLELSCTGDHFDVQRALTERGYVRDKWTLLKDHGLLCFAHQQPPGGTGGLRSDRRPPPGHRPRARLGRRRRRGRSPPGGPGDDRHRQGGAEVLRCGARRGEEASGPAPGAPWSTALPARPIWSRIYSFPPNLPGEIDAGFADFAARWRPILNAFAKAGVHFALEVHPAEIAFDIASARRALAAVRNHKHFGFNFDPSHFGYQGVDYLAFLREFGARIFHTHVKDVWWSSDADRGGHLRRPHRVRRRRPGLGFPHSGPGADRLRGGDPRAGPGSAIRARCRSSGRIPQMDREHGAAEAAAFVRRLDFPAAGQAFDAAFAEKPRPR